MMEPHSQIPWDARFGRNNETFSRMFGIENYGGKLQGIWESDLFVIWLKEGIIESGKQMKVSRMWCYRSASACLQFWGSRLASA